MKIQLLLVALLMLIGFTQAFRARNQFQAMTNTGVTGEDCEYPLNFICSPYAHLCGIEDLGICECICATS